MKRSSSFPKFAIIYEDGDLLVVSKPAGVLAVPIKSSSARNLKDQLSRYLAKKKQRVHIVHRIDRFTSGLMVFAKNIRARKILVEQFLAHTPVRVYLAVVRGKMSPEQGTLEHFLKPIKSGFRQVVVRSEAAGGSKAITHYKVLEQSNECSLVEIKLETGLKNQIRVQFGAVNHAIVGDRHYSPKELHEPLIQRQALHAFQLTFKHPGTGEKITFMADPPRDFQILLEKLGFQFLTPKQKVRKHKSQDCC